MPLKARIWMRWGRGSTSYEESRYPRPDAAMEVSGERSHVAIDFLLFTSAYTDIALKAR